MRPGTIVPSRARYFTVGIVVTNVGVLLSLIFGANSERPNVVLMSLGMAVVVIGLVLMAGGALRSRRARSGPGAGR